MSLKTRTYLLFIIPFLVTVNVFSQESISLSGIVKYNGVAVANISITAEAEGTSPAYTDENGRFTIDIPHTGIWLIINPVSTYKPQRLFVENTDDISIVLVKNDFKSIFDEVFTPTAFQSFATTPSSINNVDVERLAQNNAVSIEQYLQGKVSGLNVVNHSGNQFGGAFVQLKGANSIYTGTQPLYYVDGMPFEQSSVFVSAFEGFFDNPLATVNPMDVTDISVIKDVGSNSLLGTRGSNGVIYLQTLKPDKTATTIDFSSNWGIAYSPREIPLMDAGEYRAYANEIAITQGMDELHLDEYQAFALDPEKPDYYRYNNNTNWQEEVFNNAFLQDYHFRIRGGDAIAKYGLSLGYSNYAGIINNTNGDRYTVRLVGDFNMFEWLRLGVNSSFSLLNSKVMENGIQTQTSPIYAALHKAPFYAPYRYNESGEKLQYLDEAYDDIFGVSNPVAITEGVQGIAKTHKIISAFTLDADLTKNLKWNTLLGININRKRETKFVPSTGIVRVGEIYNYTEAPANHYKSIYVDSKFDYSYKNSMHRMNATAGFRVHTNNYEYDLAIGRNLHESNQLNAVQDGRDELAIITGNYGDWNWLSNYFNVNYAYKDRYLLSATTSIDVSSRTGENADYDINYFKAPAGLFYGLQVGWDMANEYFMKDLFWLNQLKLRLSTGKTGNDDIGNYTSRSYYETRPYRSVIGIVSNMKPNTSLKYEEVYGNSLGLDIAMFGQRIFVSAEFHSGRTEDMLVYTKLPDYYGVEYAPVNAGEMSVKGWNIDLASRIVDNQFKIDLGLTLSASKSKITQIANDKLIVDVPGASKAYIEGKEAGIFWGYKTGGVYSTSQEALADGFVNTVGEPYQGGDIRFLNISDDDNVINDDDRVEIGNPNPDLIGSFFANFAWKNWTLNSTFYFSIGNDVFNYVRYNLETASNYNNQSITVLNRWITEGNVTDMPRAVYNDPMGNSNFSDRWIEDGSYLRLSNLAIGYNVPNVKVIKSLNVFLSGQNLLTFSKYLGYDPEFSYSNSQLVQGVDYGLIPQSKRFLMGVKIGF